MCGMCLEVLKGGAARGMGREGKRTPQPATLNCSKSYSIVAVTLLEIVWGSSLGRWGVMFCNNHPVLAGWLPSSPIASSTLSKCYPTFESTTGEAH
jgi:hypothetical protein